jgi:protein-L-isoaspartate(D-aspartate) O-methyltransferase
VTDEVSVDRLMRFILELRQGGVTDARVLSAMERTPRTHFAPAQFSAFALEDKALPLGDGEQMSKPSTVARMLAALDMKGGDTVLEVGSGSGYQAAVIGAVARRVISLERRQPIAAAARGKIGELRAMHVYIHFADGHDGWADDGPFDRIVINASVAELPAKLLMQLTVGGVIVAPIGSPDGPQRLMQGRKGVDGALAMTDCGPISFRALEPGVTT